MRTTVKLSFNWIIIILLLAAALVVARLWEPAWDKPLTFIGSAVGATAALLTAVHSIDVRRARLEQTKALTALDFAHRWDSPQFVETKRIGRELLRELKRLAQATDGERAQEEYLKKEPVRETALAEILNFLETLAVAVQRNVADEEMSRCWFYPIVLAYWQAAAPFVRTLRRDNPRVFIEVENLYDSWRQHGPATASK